eukprot:scaffold37701_cov17-Tisochrysis_lutea.AAC.1
MREEVQARRPQRVGKSARCHMIIGTAPCVQCRVRPPFLRRPSSAGDVAGGRPCKNKTRGAAEGRSCKSKAMSRKAALARAASEGHAAQVASLAAQKEEATRTAHELQLQLTKERLESKAAEQSLLAAEATTAHAKQQAAAAQGELAEVREALHAEKRATQGALAEVSTASVQMAQLQAKLRDKMVGACALKL